jgi:peptidoglycan hydrolase CwlO-like protein
MNKELQRAQDMIDAMRSQRDTALNTVVIAQADINAHLRTITELQMEIARLKEPTIPGEVVTSEQSK